MQKWKKTNSISERTTSNQSKSYGVHYIHFVKKIKSTERRERDGSVRERWQLMEVDIEIEKEVVRGSMGSLDDGSEF